MNDKIKGTTVICKTEKDFKFALSEIPKEYNIIAIKNDFSSLVFIPSINDTGSEDIDDPKILGVKYFLFLQGLLSNRDHRKMLDKYIEEVMKDYYLKDEFKIIQ